MFRFWCNLMAVANAGVGAAAIVLTLENTAFGWIAPVSFFFAYFSLWAAEKYGN